MSLTPRRSGVRAVLSAASIVVILSTACSGVGSTLPTDLDATRVIVIGDFGTGAARERDVAGAIREAAARNGLDGLVTTGDNVYPDGAPRNFNAAWKTPYGWTTAAAVRIVGSLGNHDVVGGHATAVMALLGMPGRYFTMSIGALHFVVLDSNIVADRQQMSFLRRILGTPLPSGTAFRVVVFHHPAHSCARHGSTPAVVRMWRPLLERSRVDLVINGHDHVYERFEGRSGGPAYVVTGGGGADLHPLRTCPSGTPLPEASAVAHHYVIIEATTQTLRLRALGLDGRVLDAVERKPVAP